MTPSRDISRLVEIMRRLRDREHGCPWDIEQTPHSIIPFTIEETYEVVDAIERNDPVDLREELGDLLLQVVYHTQFAAERDEFEFGDVVEAITTKMIRRHPHVFGEVDARDADAAKASWNAIKADEKSERAAARSAAGLPDEPMGVLDKVKRSLPPLAEASELQRRMAGVGFDWSEPADILDKVREETDELDEAMRSGSLDELTGEVGDLLFVVVNLARRLGVDPELALRGTNAKARRRFGYAERRLADRGRQLGEASLEEIEEGWQEAKHAERNAQSSGS